MKKQFMKLTMPKFKLSTNTDLTDALQDQGIEKVFTQEADFTPIVGPELGDKDRGKTEALYEVGFFKKNSSNFTIFWALACSWV